jgi:hypothetical protein
MPLPETIWRNETHPGYQHDAVVMLPYLTAEQNLRAERVRQCRMLFDGRHRAYFLSEGRTQFNFPPMRVNDRDIIPFVPLRVLRLLSFKSADLVFGDKAKLSVDDAIKRMALDALAKRSKVHSRFHAAAVAASWAGGAFLLSCIWRGQAYVTNLPPDEVFPVGPATPDDQYERYERYQVATVGEGADAYKFLLKTIYTRGAVERHAYQLAKDNSIVREVDLKLWPGIEASYAPMEQTGLAENVITFVPNELDGGECVSDYDGLVQTQDAINASMTQISRINALHAEPAMGIPQEMFDANGNINLNKYKAFPFRTKDEIPTYITPQSNIDGAMADRKFKLEAFCVEAEISQILLGVKEGAAPTAARTLRLEMTNSLAKAQRKRNNIEPAAERALEVALMLDAERPVGVFLGGAPVSVEARDGLPIDELDEASIVSTYRGSDSMSLEAAVERRVRDPDATAEEVRRIKEERAAATPPILFGEPGETRGQPDEAEPAAMAA